jgi:hypothetical protein
MNFSIIVYVLNAASGNRNVMLGRFLRVSVFCQIPIMNYYRGYHHGRAEHAEDSIRMLIKESKSKCGK